MQISVKINENDAGMISKDTGRNTDKNIKTEINADTKSYADKDTSDARANSEGRIGPAAAAFFRGRYCSEIIAAAAVLLFMTASAVYFNAPQRISFVPPEDAYAAGTSADIPVYVIEENENAEGSGDGLQAVKSDTVIRGTQIIKYADEVAIDDETYVRIEKTESSTVNEEDEGEGAATETDADASDETDKGTVAEADRDASDENDQDAADEADQDADLYMKASNIAESPEAVVLETEVYVRTPATIYENEEGPAIASFTEKGSCLKVLGYDRLNEDGSVNKYRVAYGEGSDEASDISADASSDGAGDPEGSSEDDDEALTGYVYGKYMVNSLKKAKKKYNGNGIYDQAKRDKYGYDLYGGKASHLDYYPYEKPVIEGNEFCRNARTMYLNCAAAANPDEYIKIINKTDCNAVVCDIKDGVMAYKSQVAKEWSPRSYKTAYTSRKKYKEGIDALRDSGVYLIGRIVVFNDPIYAKDHPEDCIKYQGETTWPSAYSRDVWEYNVRLAQEAIEEFGFNEIQFDYVRFPESSYGMSQSKKTKWRNKYDEEKGQAVQNFCFYAADQIHEAGAYFSIDVFGESVYGYMTAYGQYWPALSNIVDAISAMPYTDHMGGEGAWRTPYRTMKAWAKKAKKSQKDLDNPAAARTWITGYDTPYWDPEINYGKKLLKSQVKALTEQGLDGGFIPWNAASSLKKYRQYKSVWNE